MKRLLLLSLLSFPLPALAQVAVQFTVPGVRVMTAPPPARVEVQTARPSPSHMWIGGHWAWRANAHVWIPGHWAQPPVVGYTWEPARWVNQNGQWVFYEGHWRAPAPQPTVVYEPAPAPAVEVEEAPPAPIVETPPAAPFAGAVWTQGYWHWNGHHHVWVGGRYSAPRAGWGFVPGHWEPRGNHYKFVPAHWQKQ
jgi:hypothetical protein